MKIISVPIRGVALLLGALVLSTCKHPVVIAEERGSSGWLQIDRPGFPAATGYDDRFSILPLSGADPGCASLGIADQGLVVVLVHGIHGDGLEFEEVVPVLAAAKPTALFMFRWVPFDKLDRMTDSLALGVSRLAACLPHAEVLVMAHSAGGVVVSSATGKIKVPDGAPDGAVKILTVASPLAGTMNRPRHPEGKAESRFLLDLGTAFTEYPAAPRGVRAVHLRTQYPADQVMAPKGDHLPNDPKVGIGGSVQIDLPADLGHSQSLIWVGRKIADGTWRAWFDAR